MSWYIARGIAHGFFVCACSQILDDHVLVFCVPHEEELGEDELEVVEDEGVGEWDAVWEGRHDTDHLLAM